MMMSGSPATTGTSAIPTAPAQPIATDRVSSAQPAQTAPPPGRVRDWKKEFEKVMARLAEVDARLRDLQSLTPKGQRAKLDLALELGWYETEKEGLKALADRYALMIHEYNADLNDQLRVAAVALGQPAPNGK